MASGNCYYCQYFLEGIVYVGGKWFPDCCAGKRGNFYHYLGSVSVLMNAVSIWTHRTQTTDTFWIGSHMQKIPTLRKWRAAVIARLTFIRCWFIHFVNVFFCTLSLSSEVGRGKKEKRHLVNHKAITIQHKWLLTEVVIRQACCVCACCYFASQCHVMSVFIVSVKVW